MQVGVIGAGARCKLALHTHTHGAQVTIAADPSPQGASRVRKYLGQNVRHVATTAEVIRAGVDCAFVTSPDHTHAAVTCELLRAGIAVYLEKPIAITTTDADRVLQVAYETKTPLYVGHNMRHMHVVQLLRDAIHRGEVGEVQAIWTRHFVGHGGDFYFKDWHATRAGSTGLLLQKGAHDIDVMHWLANSTTREVTAMGALQVYGNIASRRDNSAELMTDWFNPDNYPPAKLTGLNPTIDVEDTSMMVMRMHSGVLASYQQCHFTPDYWRNYTVIGDEGRLENFGDSAGGVVRLWNTRGGYRSRGDKEYPIRGDHPHHGDADARTVSEFMRFITTGGATATSPVAARDAVATAAAATTSLRDGARPVSITSVPCELAEYFARGQRPDPREHSQRLGLEASEGARCASR